MNSSLLRGYRSFVLLVLVVGLGLVDLRGAQANGRESSPSGASKECPSLANALDQFRGASQARRLSDEPIPTTREHASEPAEGVESSQRASASGAPGGQPVQQRGQIPPTVDIPDFEQWRSLADALPAQRVTMPGLRTRIRLGEQLATVQSIGAAEPYHSAGDVYFTGWGVARTEAPQVRVVLPDAIQFQFNETTFEASSYPPATRAIWLTEQGGLPSDGSVRTRVSQGMQSEVFWVHPPVPPSVLAQGRELAGQDPEAARYVVEDWIRFHATRVVKVTRFDDAAPTAGAQAERLLQANRVEAERRARLLRRDVIGNQLARALLADVRGADGHRLLEVAELHASEEQLRGGVLLQNAAHGFSLFEIQTAMDRLDPATSSQRRVASMSEGRARRILELSNLRSLEDRRVMRQRILAIEEAYRQVHRYALGLQRVTQIEAALSNSSRGGMPGVVGLDYNHGSNVIWDGARAIGIVIDR